MNDVIQLLPDSVANQIAAGEVIQRPASVIKELMENSVDAGASNIDVVVKDAGRTLIQVVDDGAGMSVTDARLAFERHSTSKIRKADDLFSLHTMGFRGEALASIAAISNVELRTRTADSELGTSIEINASKFASQEPIACPSGCNFMIKNIFFNVPARRKFLKSNQVEMSNIISEFERVALINYNIGFSLTHNDNITFKMPAETFKARIKSLFGKNIDTQLLPIETDTSLISVSGFIGRPEYARKRNAMQYMFVNGRYMKHPYFHKAIMTCYEQIIPTGEQPNYFLCFHVNPETIDVNIHPTKTEIKFENEQSLWQIIAAAVKESLGKFNAVPSIDFDTEDAPELPIYTNSVKSDFVPSVDIDTSYNPFKVSSKSQRTPIPNSDWNKLYQNFENERAAQIEYDLTSAISPDEDVLTSNINNNSNDLLDSNISETTNNDTVIESLINNEDKSNVKLFQLNNKYIVYSIYSNLVLIDQHRAHVRILFEKFMSVFNNGKVVSQRLVFPETFQLDVSQNEILTSIQQDLELIGFDLSFLGSGMWAVNACPMGAENIKVENIVNTVIERELADATYLKSHLHETLALSMARSLAISAGKVLSEDDMNDICNILFSFSEPNYTPYGKLIMKTFSPDEIAKFFN